MTLMLASGAAHAAGLSQLTLADSQPLMSMTPDVPRSASRDGQNETAPKHWETFRVKRGDTLSALFRRAGLQASQWRAMLAIGNVVAPLRTLHPGDLIRIRKTPDKRLAALYFRLSPTQSLVVRRQAGGLTAAVKHLQTERRQTAARGIVKTSLQSALHNAGVPAQVAGALRHIYAARVDLNKTIKAGDRFNIIYNTQFVRGSEVKAGPVIAASLHAGDKVYRIFRHVNANGQAEYYDAAGKPYAPSIERTPLNYTRVSSQFSRRRKDPVVGVIRPHTGVDLAAPRGTPVHAAADGTISFVGWRHGYGRLIKISNGGEYSTRYAHLSKFASGLHAGQHVMQGQVIGYVGESGFATGYHLHFEIRKNGTPYNPLKVALPNGTKLAGHALTAFTSRIQPLIARLSADHISSSTLIAANTSADACPGSGIVNTMLALAPNRLKNSQLNDVFCTSGS